VALLASVLVLLAGAAPGADAASVHASWTAKFGANGSVTLVQYASGAGAVGMHLVGMTPAARYAVVLARGTCARHDTWLVLPTVTATSTGRIGRTLPLGVSQAGTAAGYAGNGLVIRVGSRCGAFTGRPTIASVLATLTVAPEHRAGYSRELFHLWIDADHDGCDTRREVLIAEAVVAPVVSDGCILTGGTWLSYYDGKTFTDPAALDIDHVVPLAEAWDSGASTWTAARREAYANDLGVPWALVAVSAASNRSKGDQDPATWLPPSPAATCTYLAAWVEVKIRWSLSIDPLERTAIAAATPCLGTRVSVVPAPATP
jgi:hypothetical protein